MHSQQQCNSTTAFKNMYLKIATYSCLWQTSVLAPSLFTIPAISLQSWVCLLRPTLWPILSTPLSLPELPGDHALGAWSVFSQGKGADMMSHTSGPWGKPKTGGGLEGWWKVRVQEHRSFKESDDPLNALESHNHHSTPQQVHSKSPFTCTVALKSPYT